ncbi:hypothetical protein DFH27DRAFT_100072 [Peziza echinospora]|nr:hypothetical protein DFH27DRAFT_100072 [Peziza echinospora]
MIFRPTFMQYSLAGAPLRQLWRPWPLRTTYLLLGAILCIVIAGLLQLIIMGCGRDGCRVFGDPSTQRSSKRDQTMYRVLPAFLSVCFTFLWAVVRHDVMRLEPYFQMSVPGGATAKNSLLLEYNYMFPHLALWQALKRR